MVAAFSNAQGFGAKAFETYDRSKLQVIFVTNTNNSGAGSLRQAVADSRVGELDIVIFRVGGTINLSSTIAMQNVDGLRFAGQSAPGGGIQVRRDDGLVFSHDRDGSCHDNIMQYLRIRQGRPVIEVWERDAMNLSAGHNLIFDHLSVQWGTDGVFDMVPIDIASGGEQIRDITVQYSIIAEGLRAHSTGMGLGSHGFLDGDKKETLDISIHHNIFAHNSHRNPLTTVTRVQVANNLVYNWRNWSMGTTRDSTCDYVNNYLTKGPWAVGGSWEWMRHHSARNSGDDTWEDPSILLNGNIFDLTNDGLSTVVNDDFAKIVEALDTINPTRTDGDPIQSSFERTTPIAAATYPVILQTALAIRTSLLADCGCHQRLDEDGKWVDTQDVIDSDIISDIQNNTGNSGDSGNDNFLDHGGFPTIADGTPYTDSNNDGIPDAWSIANGISATGPGSHNVDSGDGRTFLERFLDGESVPSPASGSGGVSGSGRFGGGMRRWL